VRGAGQDPAGGNRERRAGVDAEVRKQAAEVLAVEDATAHGAGARGGAHPDSARRGDLDNKVGLACGRELVDTKNNKLGQGYRGVNTDDPIEAVVVPACAGRVVAAR
jgi:hypothetical protein